MRFWDVPQVALMYTNAADLYRAMRTRHFWTEDTSSNTMSLAQQGLRSRAYLSLLLAFLALVRVSHDKWKSQQA